MQQNVQQAKGYHLKVFKILDMPKHKFHILHKGICYELVGFMGMKEVKTYYKEDNFKRISVHTFLDCKSGYFSRECCPKHTEF
jgi:hypothetical protein